MTLPFPGAVLKATHVLLPNFGRSPAAIRQHFLEGVTFTESICRGADCNTAALPPHAVLSWCDQGD